MTRIEVGYVPIEVHVPFHKSAARERHMFGAVGSGKTYAVTAEAVALCLEQPGIRGLITRKTIPELRDTTETVFFDVLPDEIFRAGETTRIGGHYADFTFPNGSKVLFRSIDDWKKHKSLNLGFIGWDEMDEFDEETYIGMGTRLRQRDPTKEGRRYGAGPITRRCQFGASNPEGRNWIWRRFVKEGQGEYFKSTSFDNPYLSPDYFEYLLSMPEAWIRRYVACQFDEFGGQIYEKWGWDTHVVPRYPRNPFDNSVEYPPHSAVWMGMDPGTRDPTAGLWVVVERQPRLRLVGVAEYQEADLAANVHARAWRKIESQHQLKVRRRIADPNRINVRDPGSNNTLSDQFRRLGFRFELGPSRFDDRIPALANLMETGQFVVTEDCMQTYESIRDARWKDLTPAQRSRGEDPPEKPLKKNRHLCDTAEYLAGRWTKPVLSAPTMRDDRPDWMTEAQQTIAKRIAKAGSPKRVVVEGVPVG